MMTEGGGAVCSELADVQAAWPPEDVSPRRHPKRRRRAGQSAERPI